VQVSTCKMRQQRGGYVFFPKQLFIHQQLCQSTTPLPLPTQLQISIGDKRNPTSLPMSNTTLVISRKFMKRKDLMIASSHPAQQSASSRGYC
jgi:hypothetical protein